MQSGSQKVSVLISEAEPRVLFSTISDGNWSDSGTWLNGNIPSSITDEAAIKHSVALTGDVTIGSISFEGINSEVKLNGRALSIYGSHQKISGKGFSGDSLSKITVNGWEEGSDPFEFNSGKRKLSELKVDVSADTVEIGSSLNIYQKLNLEAGSLKQTAGELTLISDENNTAQLIKNGGKLISDFVYSRAYTEEASGWRMISSPFNDANFSSLNESFLLREVVGLQMRRQLRTQVYGCLIPVIRISMDITELIQLSLPAKDTCFICSTQIQTDKKYCLLILK